MGKNNLKQLPKKCEYKHTMYAIFWAQGNKIPK